MICPRCGTEWDASKSPCTRCGFVVRGVQSRQVGSGGRAVPPPPQSSRPLSPSLSQGSLELPPLPPLEDNLFAWQERAGDAPVSRNMPPVNSVPPRPVGHNPSAPPPRRSADPATPVPDAITPYMTNFPEVPRPEISSSSFSGFTPGSAAFPQKGMRNVPLSGNGGPSTSSPDRTSFGPTSPERSSPSAPLQHGSGTEQRTSQTFPFSGEGSSGTPPGKFSPSDVFQQRNATPRPPTPGTGNLSSGYLKPEGQAPAFKAHRLVTDPLSQEAVQHVQQAFPSPQQSEGTVPPPHRQEAFYQPKQNEAKIHNGPFSGNREASSATNEHQLLPGTILRSGRYRLQEMKERQEWLAGVYESAWIAQDAHRGGAQVVISELIFPEGNISAMQPILRTATMALTSVGRHPHVPALLDAFSDKGHNFFVFELIKGESILARMERTRRALTESEVIEICLQVIEVLELLAMQSPPLIHGRISPEHIIIAEEASQYILTNFSLVLAGGAIQFVSGVERTLLPVYTAPEFVRGVVDIRSDLYSLLATAYHAVTGAPPAGVSGSIPSARRINPTLSPQFDAILTKGLRPIASQRYQRPAELRQELLAIRSVSGSLVQSIPQHPDITQPVNPNRAARVIVERPALSPIPASPVPDSLAQALQSLVPAEELEERKSLLPRPEDLPPLEPKNDWVQAGVWLGVILLCLLIIILMSPGRI